MGTVLDAIGTFFEQLADVNFGALRLAICCHLLKTCCTSMAWRNTIAAAYPETPVRWRSIWAAYLSGVGVNAIIPAQAGDAVKLYLAHRAVPGSTYTALGATLFVLSLFDMAAAGLLFVYASRSACSPGIGSLGSLPGFDFRWVAKSPEFAVVLFIALAILLVIGLAWVRLHLDEFKERVRQGSWSSTIGGRTRPGSRSGRPATGPFASPRSGSSSTPSESTSRCGTSSSSR